MQHSRNAAIGFVASAVSETVSNAVKVIKTIKQTKASATGGSIAYADVFADVMKHGGLIGLASRGLMTRILASGIQSIVFTVVWKWFAEYLQTRADAGASADADAQAVS